MFELERVRVIEGSSYWESTVTLFNQGSLFSNKAGIHNKPANNF